MTTRLSHPWYNLVDAIHACYNLVFSVWAVLHLDLRESFTDLFLSILSRSQRVCMQGVCKCSVTLFKFICSFLSTLVSLAHTAS